MEPEAPPAPRSCRRRLLLGCGVLAIVGAVVAGGLAFLVFRTTGEVEPVVDAFLARMEAGDVDAMLQDVGSEISREDLATLTGSVQAVLGRLKSKTWTGIHVNSTPGGTTAQASYSAQYDKGPADLRFVLRKEQDRWRIQTARFNSPLFDKAATCPKCGKSHRELVKFCSGCGAEIPAPGK